MAREHDFWHPELGHWKTVTTPTPEQLAEYPDGTVEVPPRPGPDYTFDEAILDWVHTPPTTEERRAEMRAEMRPITARQLRLTLVRAGVMLGTVEAALNAIPDEQERAEALIEWEYASHYERLHPLILALAPALDLTEEQVDAFWDQALGA